MTKLKPYTKYKDSGSPWIGSIPDHWEIKPLRAMLNQRNEKNDPIKTDQILSLSIAHGVTLYSDKGRGGNKAKSDLSAYKIAKKGDIVLNSMNVIVGAVGLSSFTGAISPVYYALYVKNNDSDIKYYEKIFKSSAFQKYLMIYGKGILIKKSDSGKLNTIRMKIPTNDLKITLLPHPPISEQKAIEQYLNSKSNDIDKYIKKLKREISLLKEHRQKIISQAVTCGLDGNGKLRKKPEWKKGDPVPNGWKDSGVEWLGLIPEGWEQIKVKYIGDTFIGITYSPKDLVDSENEGILVLRASNIKEGKLVFNDNVYVDLKVEKKYLVREGDLLICSRSGSRDLIGKNVYVDKDLGFSFGAFMTVLRSKHSEYLSWFLASDFFKSQSGLYATTTINQLTLGTLNNMLVTLPKIKTEREEIISFLKDRTSELDTEISKIQDQIEFIQEYKQSLISKVVTGKIDVRNINNNLSED
jgi:type I restriction enzyme S subunit